MVNYRRFWSLVGAGALGVGAVGVGSFYVTSLARSNTTPSASEPIVQTLQWLPNHHSTATSSSSASGGSTPSQGAVASARSSIPSSTESTNWSGLVQDGATEKSVQATWSAPSFAEADQLSDSAIAEWVGLGGVQSTSLIQVGTITSPNSQGQAQTVAFWENLPSAAVQTVAIPTGSSVTAKIEPTGTDSWRLLLTVKGQSNPVVDTVVNLSSSVSSGVETSADWITEAPTTNQGVEPLVPVSSTTMTNVEANGVPLSKMSNSSLESVELFSQSGPLLAKVDSISANSFTVDIAYGSNDGLGSPGYGYGGYGSGFSWSLSY